MVNAENKFKLFIRHVMLFVVQIQVIAHAYDSLNDAAPEPVAMITMNYKMKYEPKKF